MDLHCPVMDENGLLEHVGNQAFPAADVIAELGKVLSDMSWVAAERQMNVANPARPRPDIAKHLCVEPQQPSEIEGRNLSGRCGHEVTDDHPPDILRLGYGQLGACPDRPFPQPVEISQRCFPVGGHGSVCPKGLAARSLEFAIRAIDHRVDLELRKTLSLERRCRLHER